MKRGPIARFFSPMKQNCSSCEKWKVQGQYYTTVSPTGNPTFNLAIRMYAPYYLEFRTVKATLYIAESDEKDAKTELFGCKFYPDKPRPKCIQGRSDGNIKMLHNQAKKT